MPTARCAALAVTLALTSAVRAQPDLPTPPPAEPAVMPVVATPPAVPPIIVVEPPVEPAKPAPESPPPVLTPEEQKCCIPGALRKTDEYLLWWITPAPLPPLVVRNRSAVPQPGLANTRTLIGGRRVELGEFSGGRFGTVVPFNLSRTAGLEANYFFLGTRTTTHLATGTAEAGAAFLGRVYIDPVTGAETVAPLAAPGTQAGEFRAASSARSQGVEANVVGEMWRGDRAQLVGLVGYRFLQVHEGLGLWQQQGEFAPNGAMTYVATFDQFDAHNRFHGGQIGLRGDVVKGPIFLELTGKVAFGLTSEIVKIGGTTTLVGGPPTLFRGGFYALPTNAGRLSRDVFAVLPEAVARFGVSMGDHARFFVGYNFLYLSDAVRPGDQIDRTLNLTQSQRFGGGALVGPERPLASVRSSDLWLQGLALGFEARY